MWMWNDDETKELFNVVEEFKQKKLPLSKAFYYFANKYNRKPNSVRNYYYKLVKELCCNAEKRLALNIDIGSHNPLKVKNFTDVETKELSTKVKELLNKAFSIACSPSRKILVYNLKNVMTYLDGTNDIFDLSAITKVPVKEVLEHIDKLKSADLLEVVE